MIFPVALHLATAVDEIRLSVDATRASMGVMRVSQTIPVSAGKVRLVYPKYIPGEHAPSGPINDMVDLHFSGGGKALTWRRDPYDMFAFEVDVPAGANELEAKFAHVFEPDSVASHSLARVIWNRVVLYPEGRAVDRVVFRPSLKAPSGWSTATAMRKARSQGSETWFEPVSLTELVDSPAVTGRYFRSYPLGDAGGAPAFFDVFGETKKSTEIDTATIQKVKNLMKQAVLLGDGRHFRSYRFLMTFSDEGAHAGLEHHESSENGLDENVIKEDPVDFGTLIGHELFHSWNGKYRRPEGLVRPTFQDPVDSELLWVYEGLTEYYGNVLAARSGLITKGQFEDIFAAYFVYNAASPGRSWRSLADTAVGSQLINFAEKGSGWEPDRRGASYYDESALIWMDADSLIRQQSGGTKSLDDFVRLFYGGTTGAPEVSPYDLADVLAALNRVWPYDWRKFFWDRVYAVVPTLPTAYLENAGYRVVRSNKPNAVSWSWITKGPILQAVGFTMNHDGTVKEITMGGPAFAAGLRLGDEIRTINGRLASEELLKLVLAQPAGPRKLVLKVRSGGVESTKTISFQGGPFYPHLERVAGRPDHISGIVSPRA